MFTLVGNKPGTLDREEALAGFWDLVDKSDEDGHWRWKGQFRLSHGHKIPWLATGRYVNAPARRFAWELTYGRPAVDTTLWQQCSEPACVNPGHYKQRKTGVRHRGRPRSVPDTRPPGSHAGTATAVLGEPQATVSARDVAAALSPELEQQRTGLAHVVRALRVVHAKVVALRAEVRQVSDAVKALAQPTAEAQAPRDQAAAELKAALLAALVEAKLKLESVPVERPADQADPETRGAVAQLLTAEAALPQLWRTAGLSTPGRGVDAAVLVRAFESLIEKAPADCKSPAKLFVAALGRYRELVDAGVAEPEPTGLLAAVRAGLV